MAPLLTSADYPAIRAMIDISLDSTTLPDAIIALDAYIGAGMRDVLLLDPLAESRTGTELQHARTAAIQFTAARIAPAIPRLQGETFGDYRYQLQPVDWEARASALRAAAGAELDAYLDTGDLTSDMPTMFGVAHGSRGRW